MNYDDWSRHVLGVFGCVASCAAAWFMLPLAVFYPRAIALVPALLAFVSVYSGWQWAAAGALGAVVCAFISMDAVMASAALIGLALPVVVQYITYRRRVEFKRAAAINIGAFMALGVCALALVRLFHGGIADVEADYVQRLWDAQMTQGLSGLSGLFAAAQNRLQLLSLLASRGLLSESLIMELAESPSAELYTRCIEYVIYTLKLVVNYEVTGNVASSALAVGIIMTAWPRMAAVRRGEEPEVPFVPLRDWYLSAETTLYSCGLYIITSMIVVFMPEWWYGVDYAIKQCVYVLMCVQGVAVLERRLREYGMRRGLRGPMMAVAVAMFRLPVALIGLASALFGSHGAISKWLHDKFAGGDGDDFFDNGDE